MTPCLLSSNRCSRNFGSPTTTDFYVVLNACTSGHVRERHASAVSRRMASELVHSTALELPRGHREDRAPAGARGPRATKKHAAEPQVQPRTPGLPRAMVLTAYSV